MTVKCTRTGAIIAMAREDRCGMYVGSCPAKRCRNDHRAVVHPDTYHESLSSPIPVYSSPPTKA